MEDDPLWTCVFWIKCMGMPSWFSTIFTKGNNFCDFLFAFLDNVAFPKLGLLLKVYIQKPPAKN